MFEKRLSRNSVVVLDGGLTTQLKAQGFDLDGILWSAELLQCDPRALIDAHKAYLDAGAEVIISASYQASRAGFHQIGIGADDADKLIASSVSLARQAVDEYSTEHPGNEPRYVAASVGPYGAVLNDGSEYRGNYGISRRVLQDFHAARLMVLDAAGADVLACETIPSADEALVLGEILENAATPAWLSFSCKDGTTICDGTPVEDVCAALSRHPRILALGVNCTPPQHVTSLIRKIRRAAPDKAVVVYPNSGERFVAGENRWAGDATLDDIVSLAAVWQSAGATLIGGCCRVGPAQIRRLARRVQR